MNGNQVKIAVVVAVASVFFLLLGQWEPVAVLVLVGGYMFWRLR